MTTGKKVRKKSKIETNRGNVEASGYLRKRLGPLTFGGLLEAIRLGEEQSQVQFGARLGISRSQLNDIEKGNKAVSPKLAALYARKLGHDERQFIELALQDLLERNEIKYTVKVQAA